MSVAYQKVIRDREKNLDCGDLFGRYWESLDLSIDRAIVKPVSISTAARIIDQYEWLGTMPAVVLYCFGIFFDEHCGGVVVYSPEYAENLGVWDRYGYTGKIICLSRGACVHWAHPHSASRLIRGSMRLLPDQFRVVTATVDEQAGEVGTIYQACGFDFVGQMSMGGKRATILRDSGRHISGRQAGRLYGTRGVLGLAEIGVRVSAVPRKGRYFGFRGNGREQRRLRSAIAHLIKPYPKRLLQFSATVSSSAE